MILFKYFKKYYLFLKYVIFRKYNNVIKIYLNIYDASLF